MAPIYKHRVVLNSTDGTSRFMLMSDVEDAVYAPDEANTVVLFDRSYDADAAGAQWWRRLCEVGNAGPYLGYTTEVDDAASLRATAQALEDNAVAHEASIRELEGALYDAQVDASRIRNRMLTRQLWQVTISRDYDGILNVVAKDLLHGEIREPEIQGGVAQALVTIGNSLAEDMGHETVDGFTQDLRYRVDGSMSRATGNPYDNAYAESFMKTLKCEEVYRNEYRSLEDRRLDRRVHRAGLQPPALALGAGLSSSPPSSGDGCMKKRRNKKKLGFIALRPKMAEV